MAFKRNRRITDGNLCHVKNCEELTETFKKEVRAMNTLSNDIFVKYCTVGK